LLSSLALSAHFSPAETEVPALIACTKSLMKQLKTDRG
jgi:hypothetical protein